MTTIRTSMIMEEFFTPNQSINDSLNEILAGFPEPSRSRMRRKIRHDIAALHKQGARRPSDNACTLSENFSPGGVCCRMVTMSSTTNRLGVKLRTGSTNRTSW